MDLTANLIGATGLVGKELLNQLLEHEGFSKIRIFVRRPTELQHPKLEEKVVDFSKPSYWVESVKGDVLFSALGTTLKQAGSKEKEFEVDYTFNLNFARAASSNQIPIYVLVSSAGADPKSRIFYSRMKGQLDEAVMKLDFQTIIILRPSILEGVRTEKRKAEEFAIRVANILTKFILKKYRPIKVSVVARAMINAAIEGQGKRAMKIYTLNEIFDLGGNKA